MDLRTAWVYGRVRGRSLCGQPRSNGPAGLGVGQNWVDADRAPHYTQKARIVCITLAAREFTTRGGRQEGPNRNALFLNGLAVSRGRADGPRER